IAISLRTTADALYDEAERTEPPERPAVLAAIEEDPDLTASQRQGGAGVDTAFTDVTVARRRRQRPGTPVDAERPGTGNGSGPDNGWRGRGVGQGQARTGRAGR